MSRARLDTRFGPLRITSDRGVVTALAWCPTTQPDDDDDAAPPDPLVGPIMAALSAYTADGTPLPAGLPLAPAGTPFQQRVWQRLRAIPHGATATYGALARELGTAPRALAGACAANPLPILIPCHRVIGGNGSLGGYSGHGGIATKAALLRHEGADAGPSPSGWAGLRQEQPA
jgi:methylated-DNA-[protein]-cysteine S-methyltransferase